MYTYKLTYSHMTPEQFTVDTEQKFIPLQKRSRTGLLWAIGVIVIVILLSTLILATNPFDLVGQAPQMVRITNVTDRSFTVIWVTENPEIGRVVVAKNNISMDPEQRQADPNPAFMLPGFFAKFTGSTFIDDRVRAAQNLAEFTGEDISEPSYTNHFVTVSNLEPEESYRIVIGNKLYLWNIAKTEPTLSDTVPQRYFETVPLTSLTTRPEREHITTPHPAYGRLTDENSSEGVSNVIVNARLMDKEAEFTSTIISAVTNETGGYNLDLANMFSETGDPSGDPAKDAVSLFLLIETTEDTHTFNVPINEIAPIDDVLITTGSSSPTTSESGYSPFISTLLAADCTSCESVCTGNCYGCNLNICRQGGTCPWAGTCGFMEYCCEGGVVSEDPPQPENPDKECDPGWDPDCCEQKKGGTCLDVNTYHCSSGFQKNMCPRGTDNQCCLGTFAKDSDLPQEGPSSGTECGTGYDPECCEKSNGVCENINDFTCSSGFQTNMCPGGAAIQCCIGELIPKNQAPPETSTSNTCGSDYDATCCTQKDGECVNINDFTCSSGFQKNMCPGSSDIQCCLTGLEPRSGNSSSGVKTCHNKNKLSAEAYGCANNDGSPDWEKCSKKGMVDACAVQSQEGVLFPVSNQSGIGIETTQPCTESWCTRQTSEYGCRPVPYVGYQLSDIDRQRCPGGQDFHEGIDVTCPYGDRGCEVTNTDSGQVIQSGWCGDGLGCCVKVKTPTGEIITYGHLDCDSEQPPVGKNVACGEPVGNQGKSGRATGIHTHYQIQDSNGNTVDPTPHVYGNNTNCTEVTQSQTIQDTHDRELISSKQQSTSSLLNKAHAQTGAEQTLVNGYITVSSAGVFIPTIDGYTTTTEYLYIDESDIGESIPVFYDINKNKRRDAGEPLLQGTAVNVHLSEENQAIGYNLDLGFNVLSFPFYSEEYNTASKILEKIQEQGGYATMITRYNDSAENRDGQWHSYEVRNGQVFGNDFGISPGVGYVIRTWKESRFIATAPKVIDPVPIYISPGWNLIGIQGTTSTYTAVSFLDKINKEQDTYAVDALSQWKSGSGKWETLIKTPDKNGSLEIYGFDYPVNSLDGYFLRSNTDTSFQVLP